jgi:hypothetical protein
MPLEKDDLPRFGFLNTYPAMSLDIIEGKPFLEVQPFKFRTRVLSLWEEHFDLLQSSNSFPWASIGVVPE